MNAPGCEHCGLPLPGGDARQRFCCTGCGVAWSLTTRVTDDDDGPAPDRWLSRILVCAFLSMGVMVFSLAGYGEGLAEDEALPTRASEALAGLQRLLAFALTVPVIHLLGLPVARTVVRGRRWLSADGLVLLGVGAAAVVSIWNTLVSDGPVWFETVAMVLVLTSVGKWLDARAKERARSALAPLVEETHAPLRRREAGFEAEVALEEVQLGDRLLLRPGDLAQVDGLIVDGRSFVDTSALTGESEPRSAGPGTRLLAGSTLVDGVLEVEVTATVGARVQDEVTRLLREAAARPAQQVRIADRVAGTLVPLVLLTALVTFGWTWRAIGIHEAWQRALAVALIACPCALGIATPLAFWTAIGRAWKRGVLVAGGDVIEALARTRVVLLDKTGTLTRRELELYTWSSEDPRLDDAACLRLAAALERASEHPIGAAIQRAWREATDEPPPACREMRVLPGLGIEGQVEGHRLRMVRAASRGPRTAVALEADGRVLARFELEATPAPGARAALDALRARGLEPRILTGDAEAPARALAEQLGVAVDAELLPDEKVKRVEAAGPRGVLFIGDGLNDVGALRAAEVGLVADGAAPRALRAADAALLGATLETVPWLLDLSQRAARVARTNLIHAFAYNGIGLVLAATGRLTPVLAALFMVLSSVAVVLNSSRLRQDPGSDPDSPRTPHPERALADAPA